MKLSLIVLDEALSIYRLPADSLVPERTWMSGFCSVTKTADELSIVASSESIPPNVVREADYRAMRIQGTLDFSLVGILSEISSILAEGNISIFAVSTYDTDYILVREENLEKAIQALRKAGHVVVTS